MFALFLSLFCSVLFCSALLSLSPPTPSTEMESA
jgi:hypothetical protein